jgi:thiamine-phosphate pyrophosphorylase
VAAEEADKARRMMRAAARLAPVASPRLPALIALTDPDRHPDPETALAALPSGAALIWRCYDEAASALDDLSGKARARGVLLLVAGDRRATSRPGIAGLHLPEWQLRRGGFRRPRPGLVVTAAAHSEAAIIRAARVNVDAVLISPVFATQSHRGARPLGVVRFAHLARLAARLGLAAYALGGVTGAAAARRLTGTAVAGVAGIGFMLQA